MFYTCNLFNPQHSHAVGCINISIFLGPAHHAKPPHVMLAFQMGASLSPGCSISDSSSLFQKASEAGPSPWAPAPKQETKRKLLYWFLFVQLWLLGVNQQMEGLSLFLCLLCFLQLCLSSKSNTSLKKN